MHYTTIACLGDDALLFLQGQLSCDMREVGPNKLTLGCYCNSKGRVIAAPYLYAVPDGFHLIVPSDLAQSFVHSLARVIVFSKANLNNVSVKYPAIPDLENPQFSIAPGIGFTLGQATPAPEDAWQARLIEIGIPIIGQAQSGKFLPHDLGFVALGAVSFTKGCYVGQEIITRMQYKGKLKKHTEVWVGKGECPLGGEVVNSVIYEGKSYILMVMVK